MRFFRWLLRWFVPAQKALRLSAKTLIPGRIFKIRAFGRVTTTAPVVPEPRVFNPFPITKPEYRKKTPGLPGSKVARRMIEARGLEYHGEVYHTRELTEANNERARHRADTYAGIERSKEAPFWRGP